MFVCQTPLVLTFSLCDSGDYKSQLFLRCTSSIIAHLCVAVSPPHRPKPRPFSHFYCCTVWPCSAAHSDPNGSWHWELGIIRTVSGKWEFQEGWGGGGGCQDRHTTKGLYGQAPWPAKTSSHKSSVKQTVPLSLRVFLASNTAHR